MEQIQSIGAIWRSTTKKGWEKLVLRLEEDVPKGYLTAVRNGFKNGERHPDYIILPTNKEE